ncbi:MAG: DUF4102 domain-containing protein [Acidobacteriia bacterium]|nr:DUF4102 domain-containing protein [Terriglobia bacterium]
MAEKVRGQRLTDAFVRTCKTPGSYGHGRGGYGLRIYIRVRKSGRLSKMWRQRVKIKGGPYRTLGLGLYPDVSLANAKEEARKNYLLARKGIDPKGWVDQPPPLFSKVADDVYRFDCIDWGESQAAVVGSLLKKHILPELGDKHVDDITTRDIQNVMARIWKVIPTSARIVLRYIEKIFDQAVMDNHIDENPVNSSLRRVLGNNRREVQHYPSVPYHLVGQAMSKIRERPLPFYSTKLCMLFVILTACRHGEARRMRWSELKWREIESSTDWNDGNWDEVDWEELKGGSTKKVVWMVPSDNIKTTVSHRIPVSTEAVKILIEAYEMRHLRDSELVFPAMKSGEVMEAQSLSEFCRRLNLGGTPHGFRSSFRSWCADAEVPFDVAEIALTHKLSAVVRAYLRSDLLEIRVELMERWSEYVHGKLPDGWKWSPGNEEFVKQIEVLTNLLGDLRGDMRKLTAMLEAAEARAMAAEKRAEVAEARGAQMEVELRELRDSRDPGQLTLAL